MNVIIIDLSLFVICNCFCVYRITVQRSLEDAEEIERERRRRARASTSTEACQAATQTLDNQLVSKT